MPSNDSPRFRISLVQLVASALAAVTAAVAGSYLGVNGTVIGAAVASVLSVAATALYAHSLQRTTERVRAAVPQGARRFPRVEPVDPPAPAPRVGDRAVSPRRPSPLVLAGAAVLLIFAAAIGVVTGAEIVAGRPVSDLLAGKAASGTTIFGSSQQGAGTSTPQPSVTVTVVPKVVVTTPTVTRTAPTVTVSPSATPSDAFPTGGPTGSATPSDTGTP